MGEMLGCFGVVFLGILVLWESIRNEGSHTSIGPSYYDVGDIVLVKKPSDIEPEPYLIDDMMNDLVHHQATNLYTGNQEVINAEDVTTVL